ncbi:MAG: DUF1850 domain-containing protein [Xanthomonadaceae bacterium]|nr:DUF1850 domain-containing protein [Xanthomonadaceae bacterium]
MSKTNSKRTRLLKGALIAAFPLFLSNYPVTIAKVTSGDFRCYFTDSTFDLAWIHSVERERWIESYRVEKAGFRLVRSKFKTFGAGTPSSGTLVLNHEGFVEYETDLKIPQIHWIVSRNVASTIYLGNAPFTLYEQFDDYSEMEFSVQKSPLWTLLLKDSCHDTFNPEGGR